jgi:hypothetical protein
MQAIDVFSPNILNAKSSGMINEIFNKKNGSKPFSKNEMRKNEK